MSNILIPIVAIGLAYAIYGIGCGIHWMLKNFDPNDILDDNDYDLEDEYYEG